MTVVLNVTITPGIDLDTLCTTLENAFKKGLKNLANAALGEWQDEAGRQLHKTRRQYQSALKIHEVSDEEIEIILHHPDEKVNWLVTALEVGYPAFEIKPGLLASHGATHWSQQHKTTPGGAKVGAPFLDVPFKTGPAKEQKNPNEWRRVTETSVAKWKHPGFRPIGEKGLKKPIREYVKEYIEKQADKVFSPIIAKITL